MHSRQWSPYTQPQYTNSGSPHLPHSLHRDDSSNYGGSNTTSQLLPSCQGLQPLSSRTNSEAPPAPQLLQNRNYSSHVSPSVQPSKEFDSYPETMFNGTCKEDQYGLRSCMQTRDSMSRNEENMYSGYSRQVPSISFNGSSNLNPSPGPFGVLPHETVSPHRSCYDRNNDKFIPPCSKNSAPSFNNGTYTERDPTNVYSPAPLSVQSAYSGDTSSLSPIVESVTSPKFSSPNEYYSSPKTLGAYNSVQSPVPQSPSVAQHSYPSSPFASIETVNHISSAPPCSPMNGVPYGNNINRVPVRNGIKTEQSPNSAVNNVLCYNAPSPSMGYHRPPSVRSKTSDYSSEYTMYPPEQKSSPYSPVCSNLHHGPMSGVSPSRISSRTRSHPPMHYAHSVPSATISSPTYMQNNANHEASFSVCSPIPSGQPMHSSGYLPCPTLNNLHSVQVPEKPNNGERSYVFESSIVHDKGALELFNSHVDSGGLNQETSKPINFLDSDLRILDTDIINSRSLRSSKTNESHPTHFNSESTKKDMYTNDGVPMHLKEMFPYYNSSLKQNEYERDFPKRRGRRGRRGIGMLRGTRGRSRSLNQDRRTSVSSVNSHDFLQFEGSRTESRENLPVSLPECQSCSCQRTAGNEVDKNCCDNKKLSDYINHLIKAYFKPTQCKRRTRNSAKKETEYQKNYLSYIKTEKLSDGPESDHKLKNSLNGNETLKIKMKKDPNDPNSWYCCERSSPLEAAMHSIKDEAEEFPTPLEDAALSSHFVPLKNDGMEESNHPNYGIQNIKTEKDESCSEEELQKKMPKKGRSRRKRPETNRKGRKSTVKTSEVNSSPLKIKTEPPDVYEAASERLRSLRSRRSESIRNKEPEPGPSIKLEPVEYNSDHFDEIYDDSDSDPIWIPGSKPTKAGENVASVPSRKRGPKTGRRLSKGVSKRKKKSDNTNSKIKDTEKIQPSKDFSKATSTTGYKGKKEPITEKFLIAKADINLPTPFIWKVDKKSSMLQRFEISEQNGVLLYHSSFTYAAGNEISVNKYVTADVRIKSPDVVQYIGPNLSEAAEIALSQMEPAAQKAKPLKENFDYLKEDFTIYIQSLLSQDVDSSFFYEIKKYNDEYFLIPIKNIELVTGERKNTLVTGFGNALKNAADAYPIINVLDSNSDSLGCQVCRINISTKLLHFHGQPYDWTTLEPVEAILAKKTQFNVCDKCSISVSLYNRLHHHKYNLFIKCRSKACEVKERSEIVQSHEDVLKLCLEDTAWIESLFEEQIQIWQECEKIR